MTNSKSGDRRRGAHRRRQRAARTLPPAPSPQGDGPRDGFDAVRVPVRFAEDCDATVRVVAADLWPSLRDREFGHPAELVGAAAAADAAGDTGARDRLLERAQRSEREHSTYYGAAWLALGRLMLTTDRLGGCRS